MAWRQWLQALLALVVLSGLAELLLPSGGINKFAKLVLGLVIMLAVFQPLMLIIEPNWEKAVFNWPDFEDHDEKWSALAGRVQTAGVRPFLQNGDPACAAQIEILLLTLDQVSEVQVSLEFSLTGIEAVTVQIDTENQQIRDKARKITAGYLNIPDEQVVMGLLEK